MVLLEKFADFLCVEGVGVFTNDGFACVGENAPFKDRTDKLLFLREQSLSIGVGGNEVGIKHFDNILSPRK